MERETESANAVVVIALVGVLVVKKFVVHFQKKIKKEIVNDEYET